MNNTNYLTTGGVALGSSSVVETVNWLAGVAFHTQLPPGVASFFATLAIMGAHAVLNRLNAKASDAPAVAAAAPSVPAAQ
jgi:hypothetical protein